MREPMRADEVLWEIERLEECLRLEDSRRMRASYQMRLGKMRRKLEVLRHEERRAAGAAAPAAFVAGWDARILLRPAEANPHDAIREPAAHAAWLKGWTACDRGDRFPEEE